MTPAFAFHDSWTVVATPGRVHDVLADLEHYPDWWPQVVAVAKIDDDTARVLCRSSLPFTLDLVLGVVHREPLLLETTIAGDLEGEVRWRLRPEGRGTRVTLDQQVVVARPLLVLASYAARPALTWNHARMVAGCRRGLERRLGSS
ncbi:MAG TPA: SRPBCC family protein [Nocardioides sp.]